MSGPLLTGLGNGVSLAGPHVTHPSVLILGTDAVVAAAPATPVQLIHACTRAGFSAVVPASWGDELVAARVLERLAAATGPVVQCSCPLVARRLATNGDALASMVLCCVAPPVATALYIRALYAPSVVGITYAGGCPSAGDAAIDARLSGADLLEYLRERGIDVAQEPMEFDSVLPADRRRFYSDPGGTPSRAALQRFAPAADFVELGHENFAVDLAQHLLSSSRTLINLAPGLGCSCSGAQPGLSVPEWRARVREQEPPRAPGPVVEHELPLVIERSLPEPERRTAVALPGLSATPGVPGADDAPQGSALSQPERAVATEELRRRSPATPSRAVIGPMPQARAAGRALPRAYVARRRSSPKGMRQSAIKRADPVAQGRVRRWKTIAWVVAGTTVLAGLVSALL